MPPTATKQSSKKKAEKVTMTIGGTSAIVESVAHVAEAVENAKRLSVFKGIASSYDGGESENEHFHDDPHNEEKGLFEVLKANKHTDKLQFKVLKESLKMAGIVLSELKLKNYKNDVEMNLDQFISYISKARRKVIDALTGTLIIPDFRNFSLSLESIYNDVKDRDSGNLASYIPELARIDPKLWSVGFRSIDNQVFNIGDSKFMFAVQSTSKVITYLMALQEHDEEFVHRFVGREPSGRSFNGLALNQDNVPHNPYINAGAIVCVSLVKSDHVVEVRQEHMLSVWKEMMPPGEEIVFNESMYRSERATADRNYCLGYMMQENNTFSHGARQDLPPRKWRSNSLQETFDLYFRQCSFELSSSAMACVAATLANGGINPLTQKRVFQQRHVKLAVALMYSCGMYDYSGEWNIRVGLPSKSGVAGCLMIPIPGLGGLCTFSPKLDRVGNSSRGIEFVEKMCSVYSFHHLDKMLGTQDKVDPVFRKHNQNGEGLIRSAFEGDQDSAKQLLACRINVNYCDYDGRTPLMLAASEGHKEMLMFLLDHGAELDLKDRWGNTALDDAVRGEHSTLVTILKRAKKAKDESSSASSKAAQSLSKTTETGL